MAGLEKRLHPKFAPVAAEVVFVADSSPESLALERPIVVDLAAAEFAGLVVGPSAGPVVAPSAGLAADPDVDPLAVLAAAVGHTIPSQTQDAAASAAAQPFLPPLPPRHLQHSLGPNY